MVASVLIGGGPAKADANWWPAKYYNLDSGTAKVAEYTPLEKASKPWNICVLFPERIPQQVSGGIAIFNVQHDGLPVAVSALRHNPHLPLSTARGA